MNFKFLCTDFRIKNSEISDNCIISAVKSVENVFLTKRFWSLIVPHIQMHVHLYAQNVGRPFASRVHSTFTTDPISLMM